MQNGYPKLAAAVVEWAFSQGYKDRIISIDLETKVLKPNDFLTNERVLSVAVARGVGSTVDTSLTILLDDSPEAEAILFQSVNELLAQIRPVIVLGYNISGYDIPLLQMKLRSLPRPYWAIKDAVERAFILDMKHPLMIELADFDGSQWKIRTLEEILNHPRFAPLPLSREKNVLRGLDKNEKGVKIFNLWKKDRIAFEKYALGDVVDVLSLFAELYLNRKGAQIVAANARS